MKTRIATINSALIAILIICITLSSCITPDISASQYDDTGSSIKLNTIPQTIISLAPSNTEIVYALGLQNKLVGVTEFCNYPPEAAQKMRVGGFSTVDVEKIVALHPDLILAADIHSKNVTPTLQKIGFNVVTLNPKSLNAILHDIRLVGELTGTKEQSQNITDELSRRIEAISTKTKNLTADKQPKVLLLIWHDPLMAAGKDTLIDDMIHIAGGNNIARDIRGFGSFNLESILTSDPDVIITPTDMGKPESPLWNYITSESRLKTTSAIKNNRIYKMDGDTIYRFSPRIISALEQIAGFIHPEFFK